MTLKILGGKFSGKFLKSPPGSQTRPTTSLLRKAVFDMLQSSIQDAVFLDLFSGSGAMGIEALSRGAKKAIFVDAHSNAIQALKANLSLLEMESQAVVIQNDIFKALSKLCKMQVECDIIYADPPYDRSKLYGELLEYMDTHPVLLQPQGRMLLESPIPSPLTGFPPLRHLKLLSTRKYGNTELYQYVRINV